MDRFTYPVAMLYRVRAAFGDPGARRLTLSLMEMAQCVRN